MATRKRTVRLASGGGASATDARIANPPNPLPPMDDGEGEDTAPITAGDQDNIGAMMEELAGAETASVTVYRVIKNKPLAYVFKCSPDSFSLDELRDKHGGGEFRVYIHEGGRLTKNVRVMVEPKAREVPAELDAALAGIRDRMEKQDRILEALAVRAATPSAPPPSLGSLLSGVDLPATITAIGALLQIMRPPPAVVPAPAPATDAASGIDLILKGVELARELKGDGGGGDSTLMDVVRDLIKSPVLGQAVAAAAAAQQPPQQAIPPQPRLPMRPAMPQHPHPQRPPQPTQTQPQPQPQPTMNEPLQPQEADAKGQLQVIQQYMGLLTAQAASESDPALYAGLVLDQLDDDTLNMLLDRQPDPVSALIADYPPAAPYREWFEEMVREIQAGMEDGGEGAEEVESGNVIPANTSDATGPDTALPAGRTSAG